MVRNRSASRRAAASMSFWMSSISATYRLTVAFRAESVSGIVAGGEPIQHGHDLRAPEGLASRPCGPARGRRRGRPPRMASKRRSICPRTSLISPSVRARSSPVSRARRSVRARSRKASLRSCPRTFVWALAASIWPSIPKSATMRRIARAQDGHAQQPEACAQGLPPRYLSRHVAFFLSFDRVVLTTRAASPVRGRWSAADRSGAPLRKGR